VLAYQQLVDEAFLEPRERSGYFVAQRWIPAARKDGPLAKCLTWDGMFRVRPTEQRNIVKPQDWLRYPNPFIYGQFGASLFPTNHWRECACGALSVLEVKNSARDLIDGDDPELIDQILLHIL
jgi:GntR family transcriptional regulator / MocR family aminotransferase